MIPTEQTWSVGMHKFIMGSDYIIIIFGLKKTISISSTANWCPSTRVSMHTSCAPMCLSIHKVCLPFCTICVTVDVFERIKWCH